MGKIAFDPLQEKIVSAFKKDSFLTKTFYFTGGTALSIFYFGHRFSEDLDFFTEKPFPRDKVISFVRQTSETVGFTFTLRQPEGIDILIFSLDFGHGKTLKIDFNHYPHARIEKGPREDGLDVDSLLDIGANKLLTINQRTDVKDFVDLYFLFKKFTLWDLLYAVEAKFGMELEQVMVAADFLKVEKFDVLPKMLVPLTLNQLKNFFREKSIEIGKRVTE